MCSTRRRTASIPWNTGTVFPKALFEDRTLQHYPLDYNYSDEQNRFENAGKLWAQAAKPGSEHWNSVMDDAARTRIRNRADFFDLSRKPGLDAHRAAPSGTMTYTMPSLWNFFKPDRNAHGSYWFDWGTEQEVAWRENYGLWMQFINEYKNRGGLVGVGEDAGYIYSTYGFGYMHGAGAVARSRDSIRSRSHYGGDVEWSENSWRRRSRRFHSSRQAGRSLDCRREPARES